MGATNRSKLSYVLESTPGTTPSNPGFQELRVTSNGLRYDPERKTSNEIRADRQVTDQILTGLMAQGPVGFELSFSAFDDLFQAAFQGTWATTPTIVNATADTEISDVGTAIVTVASSQNGAIFKAGHLVLFTGFTTTANNDIIRSVSSSTVASVTFPSSSFTAEATVPVGARMRVVGFAGASGDLAAVTASGNALTSSSLNFTTLGLYAGMWVKIGGDATDTYFANISANNSWARISTIAANRLSFDIVPSSWAADNGSSKTIQVFFGDFLYNGTTQRAFTFERQQQDLTSPVYELFKGMQINTLSLQLQAGEIITGTFGTVGMGAAVGTSRASGATDTSASAYSVLNAASNIGRLSEGGTVVSGPSYLTELGLELNNNLAGQRALGSLPNIGIRNGEISLGGSMKAYFGDSTLLGKVINDTETSIMFRAGQTDENRISYVFDIPRVKLTGTSDISGKNADRMFDGRYDAMRHETLGYTISLERFYYLPST